MRTRRMPGAWIAAATLPMWMACASAPTPPPVSAAGPKPPPKHIHDCLLDARRTDSPGSVTHQMVVPSRYNECMRRKGWRS